MANEQLDKLVQKEEPSVHIELTVQEVNVVMGALQELPHRVVDGLLRKIIGQAQPQVAAQQPQQAPAPTVVQ
jgi:hypothetical protein